MFVLLPSPSFLVILGARQYFVIAGVPQVNFPIRISQSALHRGLGTKLPWFDAEPALGKRAEAGFQGPVSAHCQGEVSVSGPYAQSVKFRGQQNLQAVWGNFGTDFFARAPAKDFSHRTATNFNFDIPHFLLHLHHLHHLHHFLLHRLPHHLHHLHPSTFIYTVYITYIVFIISYICGTLDTHNKVPIRPATTIFIIYIIYIYLNHSHHLHHLHHFPLQSPTPTTCTLLEFLRHLQVAKKCPARIGAKISKIGYDYRNQFAQRNCW